jgi:hypothetical protein
VIFIEHLNTHILLQRVVYNNSAKYNDDQTIEILISQGAAPIDMYDCNGSTIRGAGRDSLARGTTPGIHFERHAPYLPTCVTIASCCIVDNGACSRSLARRSSLHKYEWGPLENSHGRLISDQGRGPCKSRPATDDDRQISSSRR